MEIRPVFRYDVKTLDLAKWRTSNFKEVAHFSKWSEFTLGVFAIKSIIVLYLAAQTVLTERRTRVLLEYLQLSWDRTLRSELWASSEVALQDPRKRSRSWSRQFHRVCENHFISGLYKCTVYNDDRFWRFLSLFPQCLILSTSVLCSRFKACVFMFW